MNQILTPLIEIDDQHEFWKGVRFRLYRIGLNVPIDEDYYEYMLAEVPGDHDYMLLTCVEGHKSGSALGFVKTNNEDSRVIVKAQTIKKFLGTDNTFVCRTN